MQHFVTNRLNQVQIDLLRNLIGKPLNSVLIEGFVQNSVLVDGFGEVGVPVLSVILDSKNLYVALKNIPSVQSDGDEYPCLVVEETSTDIKDFKQISITENVESIAIIRDKATWHYNNDAWTIYSDIAIKIALYEHELLFVAYDSLAGFIEIINLKKPLANESTVLDKYWSMKTDILDFIERNEIPI